MRFLFPFILILLIMLRMHLKKGDQMQYNKDRLFWERESKANTVRKKDIEHLHYITIPDNLPPIVTSNSKITDLLQKLETFRSKKILNLTGISNTDLKMEYGPANLSLLSEYDDNFTDLARITATLGHLLMEEGFFTEAQFFLELGIDWKTDITSNYVDLMQLYQRSNQTEQITLLIKQANQLNSLSKNVILKKLQE